MAENLTQCGQANQFRFKSIWLHCGELEIIENENYENPKKIFKAIINAAIYLQNGAKLQSNCVLT